jgi:hypothetical protein
MAFRYVFLIAILSCLICATAVLRSWWELLELAS